MAAEECMVENEPDASLLDAGALVAGTTVGAGILALPQATYPAGFVPGCCVLVTSWVFMSISGLLIAETTTSAICDTKRPGLGLLATTSEALGPKAAGAAGLAYAFIHYALLVAYMAQGGALLLEAGGMASSPFGALLFVAVFGSIVALGPPRFVELINSALVGVVVISFVALACLALPEADFARLAARPSDWGAAFAAAPIAVLAGVYHNVVPVLVTRFRGNREKLRAVILGGSAAPTLMFLIWNTIVCATINPASGRGLDPVAQLRQGTSDDSGLGACIAVFSLAAIVTSFFGFYFGLRSYICDILNVAEDPLDPNTKPPPAVDASIDAAILFPPLAIASVNPNIFLKALDVAGTFGITTLFLIIPAAIAWKQRNDLSNAAEKVLPFVPGGNATLYIVIIAASVIVLEGAYDQLQSVFRT